jgi:Glycosyltransferase family 10 (fucosyltransferase) C-term
MLPADTPLILPGGLNTWGGCQFSLNPPEDEPCDFWCVLGYALPVERVMVAPENILFIGGEPLAKKRLPVGFYSQFYHVVETHSVAHPRLEIGPPCTGFHAGRHWAPRTGRAPYDALYNLAYPVKENRVGVVCSSSRKTAGQRRRLDFLERLKERLGERIIHFGRGFEPIEDKLDAILPYRFQLVLENSVSPHYWTEKLADAYVGWAYPLYAGCPNLSDYFHPSSFAAVDLTDVDGAAEMILRRLASHPDETERAAVAGARERIFNDYHLIMRCARLAQRHYREREKRWVELRHYKAFRWPERLVNLLGLKRA